MQTFLIIRGTEKTLGKGRADVSTILKMEEMDMKINVTLKKIFVAIHSIDENCFMINFYPVC